MTHPTRGIRSLTLPAAATLATTVGLGIAALNYRSFRRHLAEQAAILNDTLPVNSQWWRDHSKVKGELLYVAIGDSAAQGIGASVPNRGYVGLLADHMRLVTGRTVRVINLSVSGATVELAVRDQLPRFEKLTPDVVTVAIGANDIAQWDAAVFAAGIRRLFKALPEHSLVADLPCFHLPHNERKVAIANRLLRQRAAVHDLSVVPLHAITKRQGLRSVATQFANDMFHPNDRGYRVWAEAFLPSLTADLAQRFPPIDRSASSTVGGRG
ncbi:SGNH/GDSL hydrolase family protein [Cryobacterium melibiosiphilum]|uniref:SGNH/GDSL hydrolase family protein n=1 Tax=Cryobacterium melibiosiphilum TaxID=995039 RepID=A0A3A5MC19_9MICO|nr:SGNH/GDSL hydrolase family protein [Cryobacterium melibiosiphilum]RJT85114.1 SGNH/GDSL hydrolase family protein [Cryobacterium melibiosiphilum]